MNHGPAPIRRRADGSIDTAFYRAKGRRERSASAHNSASAGANLTVRWMAALLAVISARRRPGADPKTAAPRTFRGAR